jgi:hypothetical protein
MYIYRVSGGCGSTVIELTVENKSFKLSYHDNWMGCGDEIDFMLHGVLVKKYQNHMILHVLKINDVDVKCEYTKHPIVINIYDLQQDIDFNECDNEYESMWAGNCVVNKDQTYNTFMTISYFFGYEIPDKLSRLNRIYYMHNTSMNEYIESDNESEN